jgi:colanic acid/amylovoran biosynthesis protein
MNLNNPLFILAGNGPYENRGCEAIVRGTAEILRYYFDEPRFILISNFRSKNQFNYHKHLEIDDAIINKRAIRYNKRYSLMHFLDYGLKKFFPNLKPYWTYINMLPYLNGCTAVLSVGGDNYSLDYGIPELFTGLDDLVLAKKRPMILWASSIGPFSKKPKYEKYMIDHLKKVDGIFARETCTIEYLRQKGINKNVYRVADPAFLLKAEKPPASKFKNEITEESIGLNLSPLMARYVTCGDMKKWVYLAASIIKSIFEQIKQPIYLIPHVTASHTSDYAFLKKVLLQMTHYENRIKLIPDNLNAAETKWVISKMAVFAGARTHSTIAAISSEVPTLSFAYSIKGKGINHDIYGGDQYCLDPEELLPNIVTQKLNELFIHSDDVKKRIKKVLPKINRLAMDAGKYLKDILDYYE